ncbi:MAG: cysteine--tRNA ligase [candidate division WS1 bacterium]|nr:cysteine--tRNA ligase [candidate division WS1 bacterium]
MLRIYNTQTRRKEEFEPLQEGLVTLYACGPTVYDFPHIGNLRTFLFSDLLARCLKRRGFEVHNVMNVTDVDDKTINGANREGVTLGEYTAKYAEYFMEDLEKLRIQPAWRYPRATEHIEQMLEVVEGLVEKGHAYELDGSIYFDISSYPKYGKLSGIVPEEQETRDFGRLDRDEYELEDARDFVLWKAAKPGEPSWDSPWGPGRPGWHIECTAMSIEYLGETVDMHMGGVDLIFPHHENEIAQSEAYTGQQFVRYWLHPEHLIVEGEKMSKSKGNFFTLRDLEEKGYDPIAVRHLLMTAHYRRQLNFTIEGLEQSRQALTRLWDFADRLAEVPGGAEGEDLAAQIETARTKFDAEIDDDLNIPGAMAAVFELVREVNPLLAEARVSKAGAENVLAFLHEADEVLGIIAHDKGSVDEEIEALMAEREQARAEKNWARADEIRDELLAQGIVIEDTPTGPRWRRE